MRFWYNPNFLAIAALIILAIPALKSLAIPEFYTSHDGETHTARISQYYHALADGQLPPRFAGSFYNGLGSPIFVYIYPLPYFLGSAIHSFGFSFTDSFEILMALGFIFSGIFSYLWLKELLESPKAAFLGALFYIWVPYRFLLIYVRGSISENTAYTFLPLVFFAITKLSKKPNLLYSTITALSFSLFLLSQNLVAFMLVPIIAVYIIIMGFLQRSPKFFLGITFACIWSIAIASFTYLPTIFERKFIRFDEVYALTYLDHFVSLKQVLYSPWDYGFSLTGTSDQMSFQIGLAHLLAITIFTSILTLQFFKGYLPIKKIYQFFLNDLDKKTLVLGLFFSLIVVGAITLMINTPLTISAWRHFSPLSRIDYPWRLLGPAIFATSFLVAVLAKTVKPNIIFILLLIGVLIANRNHLRINQTAPFDDNFFTNYSGTATQLGEFTPKWRQTTRVPIGFNPDTKVEVVSGESLITDTIAKSNEITFNLKTSSEKSKILINKFYFPDTEVSLDNKKLSVGNQLTISEPSNLFLDKEKDTSGLILIETQKGQHHVTVNFKETPLRLFADYLSVFSLVLALGLIIRNVKK